MINNIKEIKKEIKEIQDQKFKTITKTDSNKILEDSDDKRTKEIKKGIDERLIKNISKFTKLIEDDEKIKINKGLEEVISSDFYSEETKKMNEKVNFDIRILLDYIRTKEVLEKEIEKNINISLKRELIWIRDWKEKQEKEAQENICSLYFWRGTSICIISFFLFLTLIFSYFLFLWKKSKTFLTIVSRGGKQTIYRL